MIVWKTFDHCGNEEVRSGCQQGWFLPETLTVPHWSDKVRRVVLAKKVDTLRLDT